MTGTLLGAKFSWGCQRADRLGVSPILKKYADSEGESHSEEEVRKALEKLYSYFFYRVIAASNKIEDPFDIRVVRAHWIGNELLEKISPSAVKEVVQEMGDQYDRVVLAYLAKPLLKSGSAHHNAYARHHPSCSVTADGQYLYHLGIPRIQATDQDLQNLARYGRK